MERAIEIIRSVAEGNAINQFDAKDLASVPVWAPDLYRAARAAVGWYDTVRVWASDAHNQYGNCDEDAGCFAAKAAAIEAASKALEDLYGKRLAAVLDAYAILAEAVCEWTDKHDDEGCRECPLWDIHLRVWEAAVAIGGDLTAAAYRANRAPSSAMTTAWKSVRKGGRKLLF